MRSFDGAGLLEHQQFGIFARSVRGAIRETGISHKSGRFAQIENVRSSSGRVQRSWLE